MKAMTGIKIPKLGFIPQKIGDLIYHEGPLLSLFIDRNNPDTYYLYKWADCDKKNNRWLVLPLNTINLRSFFYKEISLRTLLLNSPLTYVLNLDDNLTETDMMVCPTNDLPKEYLPKENSLFSEESYTEFATTFKTIIANNRMSDTLDEILKELRALKKSQNSTQQLLKALANPTKKQTVHRKRG
jgi:hypothetical protein